MANLFYDQERDIIPHWHSFIVTTALGELNSIESESKIKREKYSLNEYIIEFKKNKTLSYAADLISASIVNNQIENDDVLKAAKFIIENSKFSTHSQLILANKIIEPNTKTKNELFNEIKDLNNFSIKSYYERIRELKNKLILYPYNSVLLVELSRYYSIVGEKNKAINAMQRAIHLDKNNRFILRSASRLFTHYNTDDNEYLKYIHKILNSSSLLKTDTWLMATEIAISNKLKKNSKYIKNGMKIIESKIYSPLNITELCSSIATVELYNGSHKNSRKLFNKSMSNPNANSFAQVIWASTLDKLIKIEDLNNMKVLSGDEAVARANYQKENFSESFNSSVKWFIDQPFSTEPAIFGSFVASSLTKNYKDSISIASAGLMSNPHDATLLNNIAYAYALDNNIEEAKKNISKIKVSLLNNDSKICFKATKGLIAFRSNEISIGRDLYHEAIIDARNDNNKVLNFTAILNLTREEILFGSMEEATYLINLVNELPAQSDIAIRILKKDVLDLYKKKLNDNSISEFIDNLKKRPLK